LFARKADSGTFKALEPMQELSARQSERLCSRVSTSKENKSNKLFVDISDENGVGGSGKARGDEDDGCVHEIDFNEFENLHEFSSDDAPGSPRDNIVPLSSRSRGDDTSSLRRLTLNEILISGSGRSSAHPSHHQQRNSKSSRTKNMNLSHKIEQHSFR